MIKNDNNYNHQDWTDVVIKKPVIVKKKPQIQKEASSIKLDKNDEVSKIKRVTSTMALAVRTARISKNMTQEQLAHKIFVGPRIIKEVEKGGCVYNTGIFNRICRELGTNIKRDY